MIGWLLLGLALLLLGAAWRLRRTTGLPWRAVAYNDSGWQVVERPLVAREYGLVGKPDYVLRAQGGLVPVEVKPSRQAPAPYASDLMQLAAYCLLVEATTGQAPRYGLLRYATQTFKMPYTATVRRELLDTLRCMAAERGAHDVARSHHERARCRGCGFAATCSDVLR